LLNYTESSPEFESVALAKGLAATFSCNRDRTFYLTQPQTARLYHTRSSISSRGHCI
jgi:hypothetical protein